MKKPSVYDHYEIHGWNILGYENGDRLVGLASASEKPDFWTLYGRIDGRDDLEAISDFSTRQAAEEVYYRITGQDFAESYPEDGRLRLMHAAPELLAAVEAVMPVLEAQAERASGAGETAVAEAIEAHLEHLTEAYRLATGRTPEEWDAVRGAFPAAGMEAALDQPGGPTAAPAAFAENIRKLHSEGLWSPKLHREIPWDEASEPEKLEAIALQASPTARKSKPIRGDELLAAIEREVDYDGLPPAQGDRLRDLRRRLDAGLVDLSANEGSDVWKAVVRTVGIQDFDGWLELYKAEGLYDIPHGPPWAETSADRMVSEIVGLAAAHAPPGAYVLAAIEREVDYEHLSDGRREALEGLRARIDAGELEGAYPGDLTDRANRALRLAEFECRVADHKQYGGRDDGSVPHRWEEFSEEEKIHTIARLAHDLHVHCDPREVEIIEREVDWSRANEDGRQWIEEGKLIMSIGYEEYQRRRNAPYEPPDEASAAFKGRIEEILWTTGFISDGELADWWDLPAEEKLHHLAEQMDWERVSESYFRTMVGRDLDVADLPPEKRAALENPKADRHVFSEFEDVNETQPLRDTTRGLVAAIALDVWPSAGAVVDFGLDDRQHYEAISYGVRAGEITAEALDAASGDGDKLTAIARSSPSNPHPGVVFRTSRDEIPPEPDGSTAAAAEPPRPRTPSEIARRGGRAESGGEPARSNGPRPSDAAQDRGPRPEGRADGKHGEKDRDR